MIKEHYIIKENSDDDTSISSISIVAKSKKKKSIEAKTNKRKQNKVEPSQSSSPNDFEVLNEHRKE